MLGLARRQLRQILDALRADIRAGTPIVGLEPSCVAVFRDELSNLFPEDQDAQRLSRQTFLLSEFLVQDRQNLTLPKLDRQVIVHGHCHQKAVLGMGDTEKVLRDLGLDVEVLDSGCCGMAGSFGFEAGERYEVSMKCGEQVLLPAVRQAARGHPDRGGRLQLSRTDRPGHRPPRPSPGPGAADGSAREEEAGMKSRKKPPEVVVVTGASAGVGRATVRAFARRGA